MSKKKRNKSSKQQQNNGAPNAYQPIALNLIRKVYPELLADKIKGVDPMTPEERARWEKEWRKRWKEEHINEIKHSGDFWKL